MENVHGNVDASFPAVITIKHRIKNAKAIFCSLKNTGDHKRFNAKCTRNNRLGCIAKR